MRRNALQILLSKLAPVVQELSEKIADTLFAKGSLGLKPSQKELESFVEEERRFLERFIKDASRGFEIGWQNAPENFPKLLSFLAVKTAVIRGAMKAVTDDNVGDFLPLSLAQGLLVAAGFTPGLFYKNPLLLSGFFKELLKVKGTKQGLELALNLNFNKKVYTYAGIRAVPINSFSYYPLTDRERGLKLVIETGEGNYELGYTAEKLKELAAKYYPLEDVNRRLPESGGPLPYFAVLVRPGGQSWSVVSALFSSLRKAVLEKGLFSNLSLEIKPFGMLDFKTAFIFYLALLKLLEKKILENLNANFPSGPSESVYPSYGGSFRKLGALFLNLPEWHVNGLEKIAGAAGAVIQQAFKGFGLIEPDDAINLAKGFIKLPAQLLENESNDVALVNTWLELSSPLNNRTVSILLKDIGYTASFLRNADGLFFLHVLNLITHGFLDKGSCDFNLTPFITSGTDAEGLKEGQKQVLNSVYVPEYDLPVLSLFLYLTSSLIDQGLLGLEELALFIDDVAEKLNDAAGGFLEGFLLYGSDYYASLKLPSYANKIIQWAKPAHTEMLLSATVLLDKTGAHLIYSFDPSNDVVADRFAVPLAFLDRYYEKVKDVYRDLTGPSDGYRELIRDERSDYLPPEDYYDERISDKVNNKIPLNQKYYEAVVSSEPTVTVIIDPFNEQVSDPVLESGFFAKVVDRAQEVYLNPFLRDDLTDALNYVNKRLEENNLAPAQDVDIRLEGLPLEFSGEPGVAIGFFVQDEEEGRKAYVDFVRG